MVETCRSFMHFPLLPLSQSATVRSLNAVSSFGSCKQAWYYRCLGLDP
ncbi:hypothetical protein RGQ29_011418 [Quercus rubra]|uniref:Uncharacterized protein n=1 Tax=Quercus rubra TaxID=3512 RepID=A0AAN7J1R6_QUERU|nr:hypothetical protein RGQ29_011418 [Quercus rubra]